VKEMLEVSSGGGGSCYMLFVNVGV